MIKIDFSFDTQYGKFADALHLSDDHIYTDAEIEVMKQQRLDSWLEIINTPVSEETLPSSVSAPLPAGQHV